MIPGKNIRIIKAFYLAIIILCTLAPIAHGMQGKTSKTQEKVKRAQELAKEFTNNFLKSYALPDKKLQNNLTPILSYLEYENEDTINNLQEREKTSPTRFAKIVELKVKNAAITLQPFFNVQDSLANEQKAYTETTKSKEYEPQNIQNAINRIKENMKTCINFVKQNTFPTLRNDIFNILEELKKISTNYVSLNKLAIQKQQEQKKQQEFEELRKMKELLKKEREKKLKKEQEIILKEQEEKNRIEKELKEKPEKEKKALEEKIEQEKADLEEKTKKQNEERIKREKEEKQKKELEKERIEKERIEREEIEKKKIEEERLKKEAEEKRIAEEKERLEKELKETLEKEKKALEEKIEKEKAELEEKTKKQNEERIKREKEEKQKKELEKERFEKERIKQEEIEKKKIEEERLKKEAEEKRIAEKKEQLKKELQEKLETEKKAQEKRDEAEPHIQSIQEINTAIKSFKSKNLDSYVMLNPLLQDLTQYLKKINTDQVIPNTIIVNFDFDDDKKEWLLDPKEHFIDTNSIGWGWDVESKKRYIACSTSAKVPTLKYVCKEKKGTKSILLAILEKKTLNNIDTYEIKKIKIIHKITHTPSTKEAAQAKPDEKEEFEDVDLDKPKTPIVNSYIIESTDTIEPWGGIASNQKKKIVTTDNKVAVKTQDLYFLPPIAPKKSYGEVSYQRYVFEKLKNVSVDVAKKAVAEVKKQIETKTPTEKEPQKKTFFGNIKTFFSGKPNQPTKKEK